jgi:hypothetical protein
MNRPLHPDADKFPVCPFDNNEGRIRKHAGDRYCRGLGRDPGCKTMRVVLADCLACKWPTSKEPPPPPPPKVGDVFAGWLQKWHGVVHRAGCACESIQHEMNGNGPDWCEANADYLAGRVVENLNETKRLERFFPGKRAYFRWLIRRAARYCRDWQPPTSAPELA